jgi:hypothetical protein
MGILSRRLQLWIISLQVKQVTQRQVTHAWWVRF